MNSYATKLAEAFSSKVTRELYARSIFDDAVNRDEGYSTHLIARDAAKFVADHAGKPKPFFLYVAFNAVHDPLQAPPEYTQPYPDLKGGRKTYAGMLAAMDEAVGSIVAAYPVMTPRSSRRRTRWWTAEVESPTALPRSV